MNLDGIRNPMKIYELLDTEYTCEYTQNKTSWNQDKTFYYNALGYILCTSTNMPI